MSRFACYPAQRTELNFAYLHHAFRLAVGICKSAHSLAFPEQ